MSSTLCSLLHSPFKSSPLGSDILLSTLFSNTLILHFFLSVSNQVSGPYKRTVKTIVLYILTFTFLDTKLEKKKVLHQTKWHTNTLP